MHYPPPPMPSEFHNCELPSHSEYIFDLATALCTNEREFMPPQGCDLAAPGDKLKFTLQRQEKPTARGQLAMQTPCRIIFVRV